jgi:hypothetical protein
MRILILYRPNSEHERLVEEFIANYRRKYPTQIDTEDIDSREGIATASLYDIVQYPAILVLKDDGSLQSYWQGPELPLSEEVASYANN